MTRSHREMMYDPACSTRRFKRFMRQTTSSGAAEQAWAMGRASVMTDVPKHWQTNPFPPGRRHDLYEQGRRDEQREMRRWN